MDQERNFSYSKWILIGILFIIIQSFLQQYEMFSEIYKKYIGYLTPIIYAFFTAIFLDPIVKKLERKYRMSRWKAVTITVVIVLVFFFGFFGLIVPQVIKSGKELYGKLPFIQEKVNQIIKVVLTFLKEKGILLMDDIEIENSVIEFFRNNLGRFQKIGISAVVNLMWWIVALSKFFIGMFLGVLLLLDKKYFVRVFKNLMALIFGKERSIQAGVFLNKSRHMLLTYLWGRLLVSCFVAGMVLIISVIFGVPYALLSSLMILIGNMVPYVGSIVAGFIAFFLVVVSEPSKVIPLAIAIAIAQFCDSWVVGPKIVSNAVGMNSFWVILSILIGGSLFGPIGMFFGVPILSVIRLFYKHLLKKKGIAQE